MTYCTKCGKPTDNGIMCEDCIISDSPWLLAMKRKEDDLVEQIEQLKSENALRERLEKAVELREPRITVDHWGGLYEVVYEKVQVVSEVYDTRSEAEARLAELKGEKK